MPSGAVLTVRGLLTLGIQFGMHGGIDKVHELILRMKTDLAQFQFITRVSEAFLLIGISR